MGPLVSDRQRTQVESCIAKGSADGGQLTVGGGRPPQFARKIRSGTIGVNGYVSFQLLTTIDLDQPND